ncbi:MAG: DUF4136 domain-containing protein [Vicinamibacterales bacterium]
MFARQIRVGVAAMAVAAASMFVACAPVQVRSFTARNAPLTNFHTYRWANDTARVTGDPRLDNNPFFARRLMTAADRELSAHGFELRSSGDTDLLLHFHASVSQRLDVSVIDGTLGACNGCGSSSLYDAGTIMLDLVDPKTNTLLWRAWSEGSIDGIVDDQTILEQRIDDAVKRIVATLPKK